MGMAKTLAAIGGTLAVLAATALAPPWLFSLHDQQMLGAVHVEADTFEAAAPAQNTDLLDRLSVFDGTGQHQVMTLVQPIDEDELAQWTAHLTEAWNDLAAADLVQSGPIDSLSNMVNSGDRTLYWDSSTNTAVSTIGIFLSSFSDDGSLSQEGWARFDETSGLPVSFFFGATGEDPSTAKRKAAPEAETYATWLADQWGLTVSPSDETKEGTHFTVEGTSLTLVVDPSQAPYAAKVTLGLASESESTLISAHEALERAINAPTLTKSKTAPAQP